VKYYEQLISRGRTRRISAALAARELRRIRRLHYVTRFNTL
jgi:hypothetical protein